MLQPIYLDMFMAVEQERHKLQPQRSAMIARHRDKCILQCFQNGCRRLDACSRLHRCQGNALRRTASLKPGSQL